MIQKKRQNDVPNECLVNLQLHFQQRSARIVLESSRLLSVSKLFMSATYPPNFGSLGIVRQKKVADFFWHYNLTLMLAC